jgi:hypothetical protein
MINFFATAPGSIIALPGVGFPMRLSLEGWRGFPAEQAVFTKLGLAERVNVQFLHTLKDYVYVYSFGDRLADLQVGGVMATSPPCDPTDPGGGQGKPTGFERVYRYWREHRLSAAGSPVAVAIGVKIKILAFLISCRLDFEDPERGLAGFLLDLKYAGQGALVGETVKPAPKPVWPKPKLCLPVDPPPKVPPVRPMPPADGVEPVPPALPPLTRRIRCPALGRVLIPTPPATEPPPNTRLPRVPGVIPPADQAPSPIRNVVLPTSLEAAVQFTPSLSLAEAIAPGV